MGKEGKDPLGTTQLVLSSKSGLEGRKPSLHGGVEGRMGVTAVSRTRLYSLFWHTFSDKKPIFSPYKYSSTLVTTAYETSIYEDTRLHANGLEIPWRISQK